MGKSRLSTTFRKAAGALALGLCAVPSIVTHAQPIAPAAAPADERTLSLRNLHTDETLNVVYKRDGVYDRSALRRINHLLRDHRRNQETNISPQTLDRLYNIGQKVKSKRPNVTITFEIISGYRSPETNAMLRANGGSQGKNSQHMHGGAIDFRIPGVSTRDLRDFSVCTGSGGTGYYAQDGFIHIDTARQRHWPGTWSPSQVNCNRLR